jgi:PadR family transcriptional regulator, regulatory protein PadR
MTLENWQEQLRRGGLEFAVLLTLTGVPRYGLDIIRTLEETTDLVVNEGTVYPLLARLAGQGLLDTEWVSDEGTHPRKYYRLTRSGRARLDAMREHWESFSRKLDTLARQAKGETK